MIEELDTGRGGSADERLFASVHPFVVKYCRARLGTASGTADEVAGTACLEALTAVRGHLMTSRLLRAYVYAVVSDTVDAILATTPIPSPRAADHFLSVQDSLRLLPARQREVLTLRIAVGLTTEQTADALGVSTASVRLVQHKAMSALRRAMSPAESTAMSPACPDLALVGAGRE